MGIPLDSRATLVPRVSPPTPLARLLGRLSSPFFVARAMPVPSPARGFHASRVGISPAAPGSPGGPEQRFHLTRCVSASADQAESPKPQDPCRDARWRASALQAGRKSESVCDHGRWRPGAAWRAMVDGEPSTAPHCESHCQTIAKRTSLEGFAPGLTGSHWTR